MVKLGNINVLGTKYQVHLSTYQEDESLHNKDEPLYGYCNFQKKKIVVGNLKTYPDLDKLKDDEVANQITESLRHEIIHAFLYESGLDTCSYASIAWARNEEMIDWLAIQLPKMVTEMRKVAAIE